VLAIGVFRDERGAAKDRSHDYSTAAYLWTETQPGLRLLGVSAS
jgi:hypothetical protein